MTTLKRTPYTDKWGTEGEIRLGYSSWDEDRVSSSIKWAYRDRSGKISRGAPEVPIDVLFELVDFTIKNKDALSKDDERIVDGFLSKIGAKVFS